MDTVEKIERLKKLYDSQAINEEEYSKMKKDIIANEFSEINNELPETNSNENSNSEKQKSKNPELFNLIGVCLIGFEFLLVTIGMIIGLYSSMKAQVIITFIASFFGLGYLPLGILYGIKKKNVFSAVIAAVLSLVVILTFVWIVCWFATFAKYF